MAKKVEISKEGYLELINQVYQNKIEERELALDRYRMADEQMETTEQFVLMGKNAVSFLNLASNSSAEVAALAKEVKSIVYKEDEESGAIGNLSEEFKNQVSDHIREVEENRKKENKNNTEED